MKRNLLTPVTLTLVAVNVCIWLAFSAVNEQLAEITTSTSGFSPLKLTDSLHHSDYIGIGVEVLRSVSQLFVHEHDYAHVGLNMLVLVLFGFAVERRLGAGKFAALYILSGVFSCMMYCLICPDGRPCFGASASVFGVMGAFAYLLAQERSILAVIPFGLLTLNMMAATNEATLKVVGFGPWAHAIGFIGGLVIALLVAPKRSPHHTSQRTAALVTTPR